MFTARETHIHIYTSTATSLQPMRNIQCNIQKPYCQRIAYISIQSMKYVYMLSVLGGHTCFPNRPGSPTHPSIPFAPSFPSNPCSRIITSLTSIGDDIIDSRDLQEVPFDQVDPSHLAVQEDPGMTNIIHGTHTMK